MTRTLKAINIDRRESPAHLLLACRLAPPATGTFGGELA